MSEQRICTILSISPLILVGLQAFEIIPDEYESMLIMAIITIAVASCIALRVCYKAAIHIGILPALICILSGIDGLYDYVNYSHGTFGSMADQFCHFICGVWYFALWGEVLKSSEVEEKLKNTSNSLEYFRKKEIELTNRCYQLEKIEEEYTQLLATSKELERDRQRVYEQLVELQCKYELLENQLDSSK